MNLWSYTCFPGGSEVKESTCSAEDPGLIPGLRRSPGEGGGIHTSILAWRIPRTEEPGRLQSKGLQSQPVGEIKNLEKRKEMGPVDRTSFRTTNPGGPKTEKGLELKTRLLRCMYNYCCLEILNDF